MQRRDPSIGGGKISANVDRVVVLLCEFQLKILHGMRREDADGWREGKKLERHG